MGIELADGLVQPEVVLNKVFLTELKITQTTNEDDTVAPIYEVYIEYRNYGTDEKKKRHFQSDSREILIKDYLQLAKERYVAGDPTLVVSLQAIETAIAALIAEDMGIAAKVI